MESELRTFMVVDKETGEKVNEFEQGDKLRIVRKESLDCLANYYLDFQKGEGFSKAWDDGIRKLRGKITNAQFAFFCNLLPQVEFETNIMRNDDGSLMSLRDMEKMTGLCYEANRKHMASLVSLGIFGEWRTGSKDSPDVIFNCYVVNPFIILKGNKVRKDLVELFVKSGWKDM